MISWQRPGESPGQSRIRGCLPHLAPKRKTLPNRHAGISILDMARRGRLKQKADFSGHLSFKGVCVMLRVGPLGLSVSLLRRLLPRRSVQHVILTRREALAAYYSPYPGGLHAVCCVQPGARVEPCPGLYPSGHADGAVRAADGVSAIHGERARRHQPSGDGLRLLYRLPSGRDAAGNELCAASAVRGRDHVPPGLQHLLHSLLSFHRHGSAGNAARRRSGAIAARGT